MGALRVLLGIGYFLMGLFQWFAIGDGFSYFLGVPHFVGYSLAFVLTWVPLLGGIAGIYGAHVVWGWELVPAILFFSWPLVIAIVLTAASYAWAPVIRARHRRMLMAPD
jgi:hypothetical protein